MQTLYKQSNMEVNRIEVSEELTPNPKFLSTEYKSRVTQYKLYYSQDGPSCTDQFAKLLYRLMLVPFLHYDSAGFSKVQNVLSEEVACYLPANAVVDFYKYQADIFTICSGSWCRDLTSTGYTSTAFVYQDLDGVIIDGLSINDPPGKVNHRGVVPKDIFTTSSKIFTFYAWSLNILIKAMVPSSSESALFWSQIWNLTLTVRAQALTLWPPWLSSSSSESALFWSQIWNLTLPVRPQALTLWPPWLTSLFFLEVCAEKSKLLGNLDLPTALAAHLSFCFDLRYPKGGEFVADWVQRAVCKYGDQTGTRCWKKRDTVEKKLEGYYSKLGRLL